MTFVNLLDAIHSCRVCFEKAEKMRSVFNSYDNEGALNEAIHKYADVSISRDDGFSPLICDKCVGDLSVTCRFVERCRESDRILRETKANESEPEIKEELLKSEEDTDVEGVEIDDFDERSHIKESDSTEDVRPETLKKYSASKIKKVHRKKSKLNCVNGEEKRQVIKGEARCGTCGIVAQSPSALRIHERTHTGEKPHECLDCGRRFTQTSSLRSHWARHHGPPAPRPTRAFTCDNCGKGYASSTNLRIHLRTHTGEMPYSCDVCPRRFAQLGTLIGHKRRHTGERPYSCETCGKAFVELNHLKRHRSVHSQERPFVCNVCGKGVKSQFALKQHLKLHTNAKEHVCERCGASFTIKGNLDAHIRVVHSERSGQCLICRKMCSNLAEHMATHTGEKPFACETCPKRFTLSRGLVVHRRQHSSAERFVCKEEGCGRSFAAKWVLDCHELKHSGRAPHACRYCERGFLRLCHLTKHVRLNHPEESAGVIVTPPFSIDKTLNNSKPR